MPDEGTTAWDDAVKGRIEFPNEQLEDLVLVRSDGRPTYNFASPVEDWLDGITHVIRGDDHVSNTPKQIHILRALGAELPRTRTCRTSSARTARSSRSATAPSRVDEFRAAGYVAPALMNFLALLGWAPDGETTIMSQDELIERFSLERVGESPATFDYEKLDWMNGVYLRELSPEDYADALVEYLREQGYDWDEERFVRPRRSCRRRSASSASSPSSPASSSTTSSPTRPCSTATCSRRPRRRSRASSRGRRRRSRWPEAADRAPRLKPRQAFQPIRVAVTGSKVSPGLFESLELLGRDESLARLSAGAAAAA